MTHKLTKRETSILEKLKNSEKRELMALNEIQKAVDNDPKNENLMAALTIQINRWSVAYMNFGDVEEIIMKDGREVYC
jgi:GTPase Era involved in 16S rRNA processing